MASCTITMTGQDAIWAKLRTLPHEERKKLADSLGALQVQNINDRVDKRRGIHGGNYPPSKRALREGGTTLIDRRDMIKAMGVKSTTEDEVVIGFGSAREGQKAVWAQYGTKAFEVAKGKAFPIKMKGGRKNWIWSRRKGPTPPRPFFGVSKGDMAKLVVFAHKHYRDAIRRMGLSNG